MSRQLQPLGQKQPATRITVKRRRLWSPRSHLAWIKGLIVCLFFLAGAATIFWLVDPNWFNEKQATARIRHGNQMPISRLVRQPRHAVKGVKYGDTSKGAMGDISPAQLAHDAKAGYPLYKRGEIVVPRQEGVSVGIHVSIFEGTSVTALAYGAGTAKPNELMGQGNYALSAHNMADNVTYFSPLQNKLHPNARPYVYITDKRRIYEYQIYNQSHDPKGKVIVPLTDVGVLNDTSTPQLTMTTCYEIPPNYANAQDRVIVRGNLVTSKSWQQAPQKWRDLFNP